MNNVVHHGICKTLIASFLALGVLLPSQASDPEPIRRGSYNGWGYVEMPDHTITIKTWLGGKGCPDEIVVPGEIDGLPVTRISEWVRFDLKPDPNPDNPDWKAIYIGDDPTDEELDCRRLVIDGQGNMVIEGDAFRGLPGLREVVLRGVKKIENSGANIQGAFRGCTNLETVVADGCLDFIGEQAFRDNPKLEHLTGATNLTHIGGNAFVDDSKLESIPVSDKLDSIDFNAFMNCTAFDEIRFPDSLSSIGAHAFAGCTNVEEITFGSGLKKIPGDNFNSKPRLRKITIPEGVEEIAGHAFEGCSALPEVVFPDSLKDPGYWSFMDCPAITNIVIGKNAGMAYVRDSVFSADKMLDLDTVTINGNGETVIAGNAFFRCKMRHLVMSGVKTINGSCKECPNLEDVVADESLETIGNETFKSCPKLRSVTGITGVRVIGNGAFGNYNLAYACPALTEIELPKGLETIGEYAFANCTNLTDVTVPNSVTNVGWRAWMRCQGIRNFTFGSGLKPIRSGLFDEYEATMDVLTVNGDGTTEIASGAFNGLQIKRVVLNGVAKIGSSAFEGDYRNKTLLEVYFDGDAPEMGANVFLFSASGCTVFVPRDSKGWEVPIPGTWNGVRIVCREDVYVVRFLPGAGGGAMSVQLLDPLRVCGLKLPEGVAFTPPSDKHRLAGWACSNGRRYDDGIMVFNLAEPGEAVTMTAIWE